jgi:hypothetical protein
MTDRRQIAAGALQAQGVLRQHDIKVIINSASEDAIAAILGLLPDHVDNAFQPKYLERIAQDYVGKDREKAWTVYAGSYRAGDPSQALMERAMRVVHRKEFRPVTKMSTWELAFATRD